MARASRMRQRQPARLVVWDRGTGESLLWVPALICVGLMVIAMVAFSGTAGADTAPASLPVSGAAPDLLGR